MTPAQAIGWTLNQTSAITAITSTRIYHGLRPVSVPTAGSALTPCINYFEMPGGSRSYGMEMVTYAINCRASTAAVALQLARAVTDLFHGTSSTGIYGDANGFGIARASMRRSGGVIPEIDDNLFNAPVDILLVYPSSSVT
jgi:hypothetical protein